MPGGKRQNYGFVERNFRVKGELWALKVYFWLKNNAFFILESIIC
jgi:hypothetical protein